MMKKIYALIMFGLVFMSTFAIMSITQKIPIVQAGPTEKIYTNNVTKTIYITAGASTSIKALKYSVFNNDAWFKRAIHDVGGNNNTFLLNYSIMVNHSGVLRIDSTADGINWLRLNSTITKDDLAHKTANITCNGGKVFINGTLVTAYNLTAKSNDTTVVFEGVAGARPKPHITCNGSVVPGVMKIMNSTIAYLGLDRTACGGVAYTDTGGHPIGHVYGTKIVDCYLGLYLSSTRNVEVDKTNILDSVGYGVYLETGTTANFTNCKVYNSGADVGLYDWVIEANNRCIINNSDNLDWVLLGAYNNITNVFRKVSHTIGNGAWALTTIRCDVDVSDADLVRFNSTSPTTINSGFSLTSTDADFVDMDAYSSLIQPGTLYDIYVNGVYYSTDAANASSFVNMNYTGGWSTKTFTIEPHTEQGAAGGIPEEKKTCWQCLNGNAVSREVVGDCPSGWTESKPNCGTTPVIVPGTPQKPTTTRDPLQAIPGFEMIALFVAIGIFLFVYRKKK